MTSPYWRVWIGTEKKREGTYITAAGLAQSLDRLNEERKVGSLISGGRTSPLGLKNYCEMKVLHLPCKRLDPHVA